MAYYKDFREFLRALEEQGKLVRIREAINKDTELFPLVRLQFRGLPEEKRMGFLFEQVVGADGRRYEMPVATGVIAGSTPIYAIGLNCCVEDIGARWDAALRAPLPPMSTGGNAPRRVLTNSDLTGDGGLLALPTPLCTPGWDNAPYTSASHWFTKDPETGVYNIGNYRGMVKAANRLGCFINNPNQGLGLHWSKCQKLGRPLEAAVVMGVTPNISYAATARIPHGMSELAVAGALVHEPVRLEKCLTVDLEVPADAEIVLEGTISTTEMEPEGPYGEFSGYMARRANALIFTLHCMTLRESPILPTLMSQMPPSESSKIRSHPNERLIYHALREQFELHEVLDIHMSEAGTSVQLCVIKTRPMSCERQAQFVDRLADYARTVGLAKLYLVMDEDVDIRDHFATFWTMCTRMQPARDVRVVECERFVALDNSRKPLSGARETAWFERLGQASEPHGASAMIVNSLRKWEYPPVSLPPRDVMERAGALWERLGLPPLGKLRAPWYGYDLGVWSDLDRQEAAAATQGKTAEVGERCRQSRIPVPGTSSTA